MMVLAVAVLLLGWTNRPWGFLLIWMGIDFGILSFAYLVNTPHVFAKKRNGLLPLWSRILFLPYRVYSWLVWSAWRSVTNEDAINRITNDLTVGRMHQNSEVRGEFENYVDLTAEFQEAPMARTQPGYISLPILDGSAPSPAALWKTIRSLKPGRTFVHCAQGHGRTGLFALALLLNSKAAASVDEALTLIRRSRPGIHLNRRQRQCLNDFFTMISAQEAAA
jgi:protein-tyrosine phosphatase